MLPLFLAPLLSQGLGLIANAVLHKGTEYIKEKTGVDVQAGNLSAEAFTKLHQFQLENETELQRLRLEEDKLGMEMEKLRLADIANARQHEVDIATSEHAPLLNKITVPVLALFTVIGGFVLIAFGDGTEVKMAGNSLATLVLGYYFGSSVGSKDKSAALAARKTS